MSSVTILTNIELFPAVELEPSTFAAADRESPQGEYSPEAWSRYWLDSLADAGIKNLAPLYPGSWHVPTINFDQANLRHYLDGIFREWGGIEALADPECQPFLNGGLVLESTDANCSVTPGCCSDLGEAKNWLAAADYHGAKWEMLWIGHPWLSIRYEAPWLFISEPHESETPSATWSVSPDHLRRATEGALAELECFAERIAEVLPELGYPGDALRMGRRLAGLCE